MAIQLARQAGDFAQEQGKLLALSRDGKKDEAQAVLKGSSQQLADAMDAGIDQLVAHHLDGSQQAARDADAIYAGARLFTASLLVLAISSGTLLALGVARSVAGPLHEAARVARRIADGDIIGEIADASAEQTAGLEQVHQAIAAMDQATQQNAALVEQAGAAAAAMRAETGKLSAVIDAYSSGPVAGTDAAPHPAATSAPAAHAVALRLPLARKAPPRRPAPARTVKNASNDVEWEEF